MMELGQINHNLNTFDDTITQSPLKVNGTF